MVHMCRLSRVLVGHFPGGSTRWSLILGVVFHRPLPLTTGVPLCFGKWPFSATHSIQPRSSQNHGKNQDVGHLPEQIMLFTIKSR